MATRDSVDISAVIELSDNRGVMFQTREDRDQFFRKVSLDSQRITYGAALSHAKATNLGIWGNDEALYADCVKIMAAEFRRIEADYDIELIITEDELRKSREFRRAYDMARAPKQAATHNLVRSLGANSRELSYAEAMITRTDIHDLRYLHQRIIDEVQGKRKG